MDCTTKTATNRRGRRRKLDFVIVSPNANCDQYGARSKLVLSRGPLANLASSPRCRWWPSGPNSLEKSALLDASVREHTGSATIRVLSALIAVTLDKLGR